MGKRSGFKPDTIVNREMWLVRSDIDVERVLITSLNKATVECEVVSGSHSPIFIVSPYDLYETEAQARIELTRRFKLFGEFRTRG